MRIDVYQDIACPWCRIGKRHLELALVGWDGADAEVRYHPFFLNPAIPGEGYPFREYMRAKGGGQVPLEAFFAAPRDRGADVGLIFDFEAITKAPNTSLAHQLVALAPAEKQAAVVDALYDAYFEQGEDIGKLDVLAGIAREQGLDEDAVREKLAAGAATADVERAVARAQAIGITGVPFFVIDDHYAFSGAQPPAVIRRVLEQVRREKANEQQ